jgi:D-glycero-D-manno-heptose 1,7-bisphosphate phosphatase
VKSRQTCGHPSRLNKRRPLYRVDSPKGIAHTKHTSKLIILDRDGVVNHDSPHYIKSIWEWRPIPGSLEAITRLNQAGYRVVIATNQSGIARGLFNAHTVEIIHRHMDALLAPLSGRIAAFYVCPHGPDDGCACRKPRTGLFEQIAKAEGADLKDVPAVGDSLRDIEAALAAGAKPVLVRTGKGAETLASGKLPRGVSVFDDLAAFAAEVTGCVV